MLTLANSTVRDNKAGLQAGGIYNGAAASLTVTNSTISANQANQAGAIYNSTNGTEGNGLVKLTNSTISTNKALGGNSAAGGIWSAGNETFTNTTLADNTADGPGGGIFGGGATFKNTIVANNTSNNFPSDNCASFSAYTSQGNNLASDDTCNFNQATDKNNTDPQLLPPQNNGGPTDTHALLSGSPAMDAGASTNCPPTDQRGIVRPQDGDKNGTATCDIGAFEKEGSGVVSVTPLNQQTEVALNTSPTATFSEDMDPTTRTSPSVKIYERVRKKKGKRRVWRWVPVSAQVGYDATSKTVTVDPYGTSGTLLAPNRSHKVVISTGAKDLAGNALAQNHSWTFTTGSS